MPGRLRTSFRSGNLAEHLGLLLLKGVAAVAEVARPEDVGLDAIATLLRRDKDGNFYAEDPFVVQLKSASVRRIKYEGHELDWFLGQAQPMFIGCVSLCDSRISIYPTLFVNQAALSLDAEHVTIRFGQSGLKPAMRGQEWCPWNANGRKGANVWLGEPLLTWTVADLQNEKWNTMAYKTLKRFLAVARNELELLSLRQSSVLTWSTNDSESITQKPGIMKGHPADLANVAHRCVPHLKAIMLRGCGMPLDSGEPFMQPLVEFVAALRRRGIEIDPENLFGMLLQMAKKRAENTR